MPAPAMAPCWRRRRRSTSCGCAMATISPARTQAVRYGETDRAQRRQGHLPSGRPRARLGADRGGTRRHCASSPPATTRTCRDPTCAPFELVPCDVFITEATFGLPVFRHHDARRRNRQAAALGRAVSRARASGRRLFARQGAARDRDAAARPATTSRSICTARWRRSRDYYVSRGIDLGALELVRGAKKAELAGTITLCAAFGRAGLLVAALPRSGRLLRLRLDARARARPAGRQSNCRW